VAKSLENEGYEVSHIIFFDCFFTRNRQHQGEQEVEEENLVIDRNMDQLLERWGVTSIKEKMLEKTRKYMKYYRNIIHLDKINAVVHLILTEGAQKYEYVDFKCWDKLSTKNSIIYHGFGQHQLMFAPGPLEKNAEIMRKILNKIEKKQSLK
jgi:thioesterase domain-containing protein